jgi:hypothetical protein
MFIKTLSWGITASVSSVIISIICNYNMKTVRNLVIGSFIFGCIRGYTGKPMFDLLLEG